jgi:hypothetical protein
LDSLAPRCDCRCDLGRINCLVQFVGETPLTSSAKPQHLE